MLRIVSHRVLLSLPLIFVVTFVTFLLSAMSPGDVVHAILGAGGTEEDYLALRERLGLDRPLMVQYGSWVWGVLQGDLGSSLITGEPVNRMISGRLPVTFSIVAGVFLVTIVAGVALGAVSAVQRGVLGRVVDVLSMVGVMFPSFWVALVLISLFAVTLGWLPATGYVPFAVSPRLWAASLVLPVIAVSLAAVTAVAKQTRDSMDSVLGQDFIRGLRAAGIPEWSILLKHALRNAAVPVSTVLGLVMVSAISSAVFAEKVFVLPGLGGLAVEATSQHNLPVLQGVALWFTILTVVINLVVDISYGWLNPRVRTR